MAFASYSKLNDSNTLKIFRTLYNNGHLSRIFDSFAKKSFHLHSAVLSTTQLPSNDVKGGFKDCKQRGIDLLRDPQINKGTAFTIKERQIMGIHGLLPPVVNTQDEQVPRIMANLRGQRSSLEKYVYLAALQDRNEKLFYRVVSDNIEEIAPIIYTPTVGLACQQFGYIFRRPKGLYITINDLGHVDSILSNWPEIDVKAVVVTDGERILGLGDLGAHGMGIPIGKLSLYTAMGGVSPENCLPVFLDVGTNNEMLLSDPHYIGLRHKRVRGPRYDDLIEEFMKAITNRWGQDTLIQFEDFANANAFRLLESYRHRYLMFNDDIQGTASVAVAGILSAMRICRTKLTEHKFLFQGAGEASIGIASLLVTAMEEEGISSEEALGRIWLVDSKGLVTHNRPSGGVTGHKLIFAKQFKNLQSLEEICREVKPTAAIGAAAVAGVFTEQFLKDMATFNKHPIIFALSNPTDKAECTAEQAYKHTEGRCVFASGSPFSPVTINGKKFIPGQGNNAYIFPGVALGAIAAGARHITDQMFLLASKTVAELVSEEHLASGLVYPPLNDIQKVSTTIAARLVEYIYNVGLASTYPKPTNFEEFVKRQQYSTSYDSFEPVTYPWP